jgi:hypothetical protein
LGGYDAESEAFSLKLYYGDETGAFNGFALNKNVLAAYQDDPNLEDGQNTRARNYITAVSVWTAITLRRG